MIVPSSLVAEPLPSIPVCAAYANHSRLGLDAIKQLESPAAATRTVEHSGTNGRERQPAEQHTDQLAHGKSRGEFWRGAHGHHPVLYRTISVTAVI